jgi:hypothetical protein
MLKKIFRVSTYRLISLWIVPAILAGIVIFFIAAEDKSLSEMEGIKIGFYSLMLLVTLGNFGFLFFNHLPFASATQLTFEGDSMEITQYGKSRKLDLGDIVKLIQYSSDNEYSSSRYPWGSIIKWRIITNTEIITVSSLTISKNELKKYTKKEITYRFDHLPRILKKEKA